MSLLEIIYHILTMAAALASIALLILPLDDWDHHRRTKR